MSGDDICFMTARELARRMRERELSAVEVMEAHLARIAEVNPKLNAIVTLDEERALGGARAADERLARGEDVGPLHGLPIAHKDLLLTAGMRTTFGSRLHKDFVPTEDALIVERLREAGAIAIGKTNTPEFGAGSQTYNEVFGETLNPHDPTKTCGGSSGGAAAALAAGMVPIADGSDLGGSLRNPASFCGVVGFRTAPGRVPRWPEPLAWSPFSVLGPMARNVGDAALLLAAMAGPDARSPISIDEPGEIFARPLGRDFKGVRIAWSTDLGGLPVEPAVRNVLEAALPAFDEIGCVVEPACPDFAGADEAFKVWRALQMENRLGELVDEHPEMFKETIHWNVQAGRELTGPRIARAEAGRTELYHRVRRFMEAYEFLICPATQVPPFDVTTRYPTEVAGVEMETYIDWMKSCYYVTVTGLPAISVPAGATPEGLPVGLQIVGRHRAEFSVLQLAAAFESAIGDPIRRIAG